MMCTAHCEQHVNHNEACAATACDKLGYGDFSTIDTRPEVIGAGKNITYVSQNRLSSSLNTLTGPGTAADTTFTSVPPKGALDVSAFEFFCHPEAIIPMCFRLSLTRLRLLQL